MKEMLSSRPVLRIANKKTVEGTVGFVIAAPASALKPTVEDDFNRMTGEEPEALTIENTPGMLRRR